MDVEQARCIFEFRYADECRQVKKTCKKSKPGSDRIQSIINASSSYGDHLNAELQRQLDETPDLVISYYRNYVSRYATPSNFLKRSYDFGDCEEPCNTKRVHRLIVQSLNSRSIVFTVVR